MGDRYAGYDRLELDYPAPRILQVTLNTPGRLNAADAAMHAELGRIWRDVDDDPDVSCVMIRGADKAFSAGGDLDMIEEMTEDFHALTRIWKEARDMVYALINFISTIAVSKYVELSHMGRPTGGDELGDM